MGGSPSGGGGNTTTVTKSDPWAGQQTYLTDVFAKAQDQYNSNTPSYYPGQTVANLSPTTQTAFQLQTQRALNGNPLMNTAQNTLINTANGSMLNSNPYLDANFKAGTDAITSAYNNAVNGQTSGFANGNRTGSGMQAFYQNQQNDTLAKNLNNLYGQTYYNNYNTERTNQLNATQLAPQYAAQDYTNLDALSNVGAAQDTYNQNLLNSNIDRFNYEQNLPANKLAQYANLVQGNYGGSASSSGTYTPTYSGGGRLGGALSGAASGAAMGSMIPGVGTGIGALFGGLGGAFGFSDRRLKTDITAIGKADNGLTIYRYRYIDNPAFHLGFMADEVEEALPDAVIEHESGFKMVNYELATQGGM
jgi:hypothetical protein